MILRGPSHIIDHQSALFTRLLGDFVGVPAREAMCDKGRFIPYFHIFDDVLATGIEMRVRTPFGVLWVIRLGDCSGVALHYERERALSQPAPLEVLSLPVHRA